MEIPARTEEEDPAVMELPNLVELEALGVEILCGVHRTAPAQAAAVVVVQAVRIPAQEGVEEHMAVAVAAQAALETAEMSEGQVAKD
jgi:hypothetical protein